LPPAATNRTTIAEAKAAIAEKAADHEGAERESDGGNLSAGSADEAEDPTESFRISQTP
jgi:hypothetical protein